MTQSHGGSITVYGIPNCDQIRKTLAWFAAAGKPIVFHDYRKHGLDATTLQDWFARADWQGFVNRSGTTWRKLPDTVKVSMTTAAAAVPVLLAQPSIIRRPVVVTENRIHVGFDPQAFESIAQE